LDCDGDLYFGNVKPGSTITGSFTVSNIGDPLSLLDWEVESYPDWGTWTFTPSIGTDLTPEEVRTVEVEIVVPEDPELEFEGEVVLVNSEDPDDTCMIDIALPIYKQKSIDDATTVELKVQRVRDLVQSIDLWKIIVNPDAVVETLEEISSILEEEDVRNYIEKTSEEDCGCEEESTDLEWFFPAICTLLVPLWGIAALIVLVSNGVIWQPVEIMAQIGLSLNCYWIN